MFEVLSCTAFLFQSHSSTGQHPSIFTASLQMFSQSDKMNCSMVCQITPDGTADGNAALASMSDLVRQSWVCENHQLQRAVRFEIDTAFSLELCLNLRGTTAYSLERFTIKNTTIGSRLCAETVMQREPTTLGRFRKALLSTMCGLGRHQAKRVGTGFLIKSLPTTKQSTERLHSSIVCLRTGQEKRTALSVWWEI